MGKYLKSFLEGASQVLVLYPDVDYPLSRRGGFAQDEQNLRSDFEQVAKDMNKGLAEYGKQFNDGKS
mgnify:CR=1 FL=1